MKKQGVSVIDYYKILGVPPTATQEQIQKKYRFWSQAWHPNKFTSSEDKKAAEEKLHQINRVYAVLGNVKKRQAYDRQRTKESKQYQRGRLMLLLVGGGTILVIIIFLGLFFFVPGTFKFLRPAATKVPMIALLPPTATPSPSYGIGSTISAPKDGMTLVYISEGEFQMGSEEQYNIESPIHAIYLDAFWIDQTEVTNAMYSQCVEVGACEAPNKRNSYTRERYYANSEFDNYPVIHVSWENANAYCIWAGRRLPTEAEWEKSASWNEETLTKTNYSWGDDFVGSNVNFCDFNCAVEPKNINYDDGYNDTSPVMSYSTVSSFYGTYDMAGNVWEWVADWYGESYYLDSPYKNPKGPSSGTYRMMRGGSWSTADEKALLSAFREGSKPSITDANLGFRCAQSP